MLNCLQLAMQEPKRCQTAAHHVAEQSAQQWRGWLTGHARQSQPAVKHSTSVAACSATHDVSRSLQSQAACNTLLVSSRQVYERFAHTTNMQLEVQAMKAESATCSVTLHFNYCLRLTHPYHSRCQAMTTAARGLRLRKR